MKGYFTGDFRSRHFDISRDGRRFVMIKEAAAPVASVSSRDRLTIILNWFQELQQRVPTK
jgi:hypothetical protein